MLVLGPQTTGSLSEAAAREWLVADGRGGYAMGTVAGLRTRRYHALLVVPRGRSLVAVTHRVLSADRPVRLELVPLCTWRDQHGERHADGAPQVEPVDGGFVFEGRYRVAGDGWTPGGDWYRGAFLRDEAE